LSELAREHDISLSTLKFNATILRRYNLIDFYEIDGKRFVRVSRLGRKLLGIIDGDIYDKSVSIPEGLDINTVAEDVKRELEVFLRDVNGMHLRSSETCIDIFLGIFFHRLLSGRDIEDTNIILSKGHAAPALYIILNKFGMIGLDEMVSFGEVGSIYQSHPNKGIPLIKVSSGSLGQGLSIANGIALAMKMDGVKDYVYVVMGDGELDEGQVWEAAATATSYGLDNIIGLIDRNNVQLNGYTESIKRKEPMALRWQSFGWEAVSVELGGVEDIIYALDRVVDVGNWPKVIIVKHC
jgi:transketolase